MGASLSIDEFTAAGHKAFGTPRLLLLPLKHPYARELVGSLLSDPSVAAIVPWLEEKSADAALKEAFHIGLQCASGRTEVWGIIERQQQILAGVVLARASLGGTDLEAILAPQFWNQGISEEATAPVLEWLADEGPIAFGVQ
jgi:RimJ/RimL family protein N-acetyltransferase